MKLFGPAHLLLLAAIAAIGWLLCRQCRRRPKHARAICLAVGIGIAVNETIWWTYRYMHEGVRLTNLPLQLCDVTLWSTVVACLFPVTIMVEFAYFAGLAGAGMALLTPDLWSPWPSYPAIVFFIAHGAIVIGVAILVFGRVCPLRPRAIWRAFGILLAYAGVAGAFNAIFGTNYMYLCRKPASGSILDFLGPWPIYLLAGAAAALVLFALLLLPLRGPAPARPPRMRLPPPRLGMLAFVLLLYVHCAYPLVGLLLRRLLSHPVALLNPADQLVFLAGDLLQVVIGELPPARANAALQLLPVPFESVPVHRCSFEFLIEYRHNERTAGFARLALWAAPPCAGYPFARCGPVAATVERSRRGAAPPGIISQGETILRPHSMSPPAKRPVTPDGRPRAALFARWEVFPR